MTRVDFDLRNILTTKKNWDTLYASVTLSTSYTVFSKTRVPSIAALHFRARKDSLKQAAQSLAGSTYWKVFIREGRRRREAEYLEVVLTRAAGRYKPLQLASSFSPSTSFAFSSRLPPPPPGASFSARLTHDRPTDNERPSTC